MLTRRKELRESNKELNTYYNTKGLVWKLSSFLDGIGIVSQVVIGVILGYIAMNTIFLDYHGEQKYLYSTFVFIGTVILLSFLESYKKSGRFLIEDLEINYFD